MIDDNLPHGSPEMLRAEIHKTANLIGIQAHIAMTYVEIGDDAGLAYTVRNLINYTKTILAITGDLADMKTAESEAGHEG